MRGKSPNLAEADGVLNDVLKINTPPRLPLKTEGEEREAQEA